MEKTAPTVYLLYGEDEFAIAGFLSEMESKLGDPGTAAMNISRLDERSFIPGELLSIANAMPFLAERRLVIITNPLARIQGKTARDKFKEQLESIPSTTALVLVEHRILTSKNDRKKNKIHWLEKWADQAGDRAYKRAFLLPKRHQLVRHIQERASQSGGQISHQAAGRLASLVGDDPRLADQEIQKLLAYANYNRPVDLDDVEALTADIGQGDIFALVDALGNRNGRKAMDMLHRLLEQQEPLYIFIMVVRQFRLLIQAREILDNGGRQGDIARKAKIHPFVAGKLIPQTRHFTLPVLEAIYHHLLDIDEAIKTGRISSDLALDTLVGALTVAQD